MTGSDNVPTENKNHGSLINGHLPLDKYHLEVMPFDDETLSFIMQRCAIDPQKWSTLSNVPLGIWPEDEAQRVRDTNILFSEALLYSEVARKGLYLDTSTAAKGERGIFTMKTVREGELLAVVHGIYVSKDLAQLAEMDNSHTFGPDGYRMTKKRFIDSAIAVNQSKGPWMIPAPFCPCGFIRYARNNPEVEANVKIKFFKDISKSELALYRVEVHALKEIEAYSECVRDCKLRD